MNNTFTKPTIISKDQYNSAKFAIDLETADHYLLWNEECLWVGRDQDSLDNTEEGKEITLEIVDVIGDDGEWKEVEAYVFSTSESLNDLDLEALALGRISWK